jgi:hypothetical protein
MKYLLAILPIFIMLTLAPALMAMPSNVYAQNDAEQSISQIQGAVQLGICLSGIDTFISCNNLNVQNQFNDGNNVAAQDGGNGKGSGNSAEQAIGQEQDARQLAVCVSGDGTFLSCNNLNIQNQVNEGHNVLGQIGGNGKYSGNTAFQAIGQEQSSTQGALVISGEDTVLSCNNLNVQNQFNDGNNVAAQDGGNGKGSGNSAAQAIGQSQSSNQFGGCVSGGDVNESCNNLSVQNQVNEGHNVLGQIGGNGKGSGNSAAQAIGQSQSSNQRSQCVSGGDVSNSCNNLSVQNQVNEGHNVLAQDGGNGKGSGNSAAQAIGQSQSSNQRSQCVAGGSIEASCNNVSFQNQENSGSNVGLQSGGNGKGSGNSAEQAIGQSQSSNQRSQCVSGEDAIVSCNNVAFQNQVNSGNNVLAQFGLDEDESGSSGGGKYHGKNGDGNSAEQAIEQVQSSIQSSSVVTPGSSIFSGNNLNVQNQENEGDNVAAQNSGSSGGNSAEQGIAQAQEAGTEESGDESGTEELVQSSDSESGDNTEEESGDNTEEESGDNTEEESGDNTEEESGDNTEE